MEIINIETTNICPAKCIICPREKFTSKKGSMDMELFKKIMRDAFDHEVKVVDTCGFGDPFADNRFFERCGYIKANSNAKIYISTTGYLMNQPYLVLKYVDILKLSIYGMHPHVYKKMHNLSISQSIKNIFSLLDKKKYVESSMYTIGLFVRTEENKDDEESWKNYWGKKLDEIFIWEPHNWAGLRNYRELDSTNQTSCGRPINGPLYIHVDGKVSVCCWDINKQLIVGDMNKQTIDEVYNSDEYIRIKEKHRKNDFEGLLCKGCEQTNTNNNVLIYTNKNRKVRALTPNFGDL